MLRPARARLAADVTRPTTVEGVAWPLGRMPVLRRLLPRRLRTLVLSVLVLFRRGLLLLRLPFRRLPLRSRRVHRCRRLVLVHRVIRPHGDAPADQLLDRPQIRHLFAVAERERVTLRAGATRAP